MATRLTLLCSNVVTFVRREIGEIVRYLPDQTNTEFRLPFELSVLRGGATENAGVENAGALKCRGWKTREWKSRHHNAGVENAGVENTAP